MTRAVAEEDAMPERQIGLRGYVGEEIVWQWLQMKYPKDRYQLARQIRPAEIPAAGGPFLARCEETS